MNTEQELLKRCACGHTQPTQMMAREICRDLASPLWQQRQTRIWCLGCGATIIKADAAEAIAAWNRRSTPPAVAAGGMTEAQIKRAIDAALGEPENARRAADPDHPEADYAAGRVDAAQCVREALTAALAAGDEGIREGERFPVTLGKVHQAIDAYVQALVDRQHGGVAQDRAFNAICEALGRSPTAEMDARRHGR
jgi:hypothetical protein